MGRLFAVILGALVLAGAAGGPAADARAQEKKPTIALIPGLTTDTFHITMRKGAERAAKALGVNFIWLGSSEWHVTLQVPIVNALIARRPDAILIAPTDKVRLIAPLKAARVADLVITLDTSLDLAVPGRTLMKGKSIKITPPEAFTNNGTRPVKAVFTEGCAPRDLECDAGMLLQG